MVIAGGLVQQWAEMIAVIECILQACGMMQRRQPCRYSMGVDVHPSGMPRRSIWCCHLSQVLCTVHSLLTAAPVLCTKFTALVDAGLLREAISLYDSGAQHYHLIVALSDDVCRHR